MLWFTLQFIVSITPSLSLGQCRMSRIQHSNTTQKSYAAPTILGIAQICPFLFPKPWQQLMFLAPPLFRLFPNVMEGTPAVLSDPLSLSNMH